MFIIGNMKTKRPASIYAIHKAAQAWCGEKTQHLVMDTDLAMEFAKIIDNVRKEEQKKQTIILYTFPEKD